MIFFLDYSANILNINIDKALKAIRSTPTSIRAAAKQYGVPYTSLHRHVKGDYIPKGRCTVLSATEENEIVQWILDISKQGFPISSSGLKDTVQMLLDKKKRKTVFVNNRPGRDWFKRFMQRHSNLSIRLAENLNKSRAAVTEEMLRAWFIEVSMKEGFFVGPQSISYFFVR